MPLVHGERAESVLPDMPATLAPGLGDAGPDLGLQQAPGVILRRQGCAGAPK